MLDNMQFVMAQEKLRSGLHIVTSASRRKKAGCTCVWVSRVSFDPPLLGVVMSPQRETFKVIEASDKFCINVLGESGFDIARRFGFNASSEIDKFEGLPIHKSKQGNPVLDSAVAWFDCKVTDRHPIGDHVLIVGKVVEATTQGHERPAVYAAESFYAGTPQIFEAGGGG
jgi:flavin reductase (DIM6/NTAB) family NADH-FMN oxidoreductase RutF